MSAGQAQALLRAAARHMLLPGTPTTWDELLFDDDDWADPTEPSQALLAALTELHGRLAEHQQTVPARIRGEWLHDVLGIGALPAAPDRVVVAAEADPARTPLVLAAGTAVRAKAAAGERRYLTTETLTVHGIEVVDVFSHAAGRSAGGKVVDTAARWSDRTQPFAPFATTHPPAAHRFFVLSDLLAFPDGAMTVRLTFTGANPAPLAGATWEFSAPGGVGTATVAKVTATAIEIELAGGCAPADVLGVTAPYLCVSLPADQRSGETLGFAPATVKVAVARRENVRPDAAFANDGRLDPSKEMQPFGPTPHRGDAFYLRSDEAFSKPLSGLTIGLELLDKQSGTVTAVPWSAVSAHVKLQAQQKAEQSKSKDASKALEDFLKYLAEAAEPSVDWQRHDGAGWAELISTDAELKTVTWTGATAAAQPFSHQIDLDGTGHHVRAFLSDGDFGWARYQRSLADFAAGAAGAAGAPAPNAAMLIPPDPPILSSVSITYTTVDAAPTALVSVDGWTTRHPPASGPHHAFALPFDLSGASAGIVAIGLRVGDAALGSALALYVDVESASACGSDPDSPLRWERWTDAGGWEPLDVADGTLGLRQSGVLRFVAPLDWPEGCEGVSAAEGRWIRATTPAPDTVGTLLKIVPDAVESVQDTPPAAVASAYEPLAPGQVKGLLVAAPGIKKLTNPIAGRPGRPVEDIHRPAFLERASGAVRHRWRAATAWDCEAMIRDDFPEVAAVRTLPHTNPQGDSEPGWIGAVIVPRSADRLPLPSVSLAARIAAALEGRLPVHAQLAVLCPLYVPVTIQAAIALRPGAAAVDARTRITAALDQLLHPTATDPVRFGRELFASSVAAWLERLEDVDHLETFALLDAGSPVERVTVDACRGIVASAGDHLITLTEQL